jgi:hypothetical protein
VRDEHYEHRVKDEVAQVTVKAESLHDLTRPPLSPPRQRTAIRNVYLQTAEFLFIYAAIEAERLNRPEADRARPMWLPRA